MNAEILCVGTELLMGQTLNTDARYLAQKLSELGINLYYQTTVGDNPQRLKQEFLRALDRSDLVIATGGLGPTEDDLTKETIAEALGIPLEMHEESRQKLIEFFEKLQVTPTQNNYKQVMMPRGAIVMNNERGTAPGCIIEKNGKRVIILPGPPRELEHMFENEAMPYLAGKTENALTSRLLHVFGIGESMIEDKLIDLVKSQTNPTLAPYAGTAEVALRITASHKKGEDPWPKISQMESEIRSRLGDHVYGIDKDTMEGVVAGLLLKQGMTLATAESCTGGMITSRLVDIPGISSSLLCGIVAYDNAIKQKILDVPKDVLDEYGAVSEQTARAMAEGVLKTSGADITVSTTGIAGPAGGTPEKPVGLVYCAVASARRTYIKKLNFPGDRERIRLRTTLYALDMLRRELLGLRQQ